jgi:hypothetical protein
VTEVVGFVAESVRQIALSGLILLSTQFLRRCPVLSYAAPWALKNREQSTRSNPQTLLASRE